MYVAGEKVNIYLLCIICTRPLANTLPNRPMSQYIVLKTDKLVIFYNLQIILYTGDKYQLWY